jgi:phage virion morphogenesis protein
MIEVKVTGIDEAIRVMSELSSRVKHMKPMNAHIGNIILNSIEESFEKEASPFGKKWKPVSIRTIHQSFNGSTHTKKGKQTKAFQRHAAGKKILTQSGALGSSFTVNADDGGVSVGTNLAYAAIHNFGGKAGRGKKSNIPARPFVPVTSSGALESGVQGEIMDYLKKKLLDL